MQSDPGLAALLGAPAARAPFDRLEWWLGLAEDCGIEPLIAVARDGDALAVLPLRGAGGHLQALANWYNFTTRPLCNDPARAQALLTAIARDLRRRAWRVTLAPLPGEDGSADLVTAAFRKAGWAVLREQSDVNHVLEVGGRNFAEFLAARPGALRTTLKRKGGKVAVELHDTFSDAAWYAYEEVYRASWKPEEGSPAFLRRFAREEGAAGRLRMAIARHEGRPVAAQFWTVEAGTAFIHKLAHTEDAKPLSPGTTLSAALFEQVIDHDRVSLVDFGTGNDAYKRDWMEQVRPRFRLDMFDWRNPRAWPHLARAVLARLARNRTAG